jgi:lipoprotein-anchoring transpeptidase ErfK/SrfK
MPSTTTETLQSTRLLIDTEAQTLHVLGEEGLIATYPVSTSKFGLGFQEGSFRTPTGRFRIAEKIGEEAPPWMIFKSRLQIGRLADPGGEEDLVLTRILWLEGLDPENENTRDRYIYIHGTNQEELIGTPASHGCVRLRNDDMIELFNRLPEGAPVEITA